MTVKTINEHELRIIAGNVEETKVVDILKLQAVLHFASGLSLEY